MKIGEQLIPPLINSLKVADKYDVQVALHADTLNEGWICRKYSGSI